MTRQQELKNLLHQGVIFNFDDNQFSVHECATVLKNILSELPESVLTDAHYPAYCQIAEFCSDKNSSNNDRLLRALQLLILLLPNENRKFFQEIIELLNLAVTHEAKNRMSADNLATLFTPHLLCPRKVFIYKNTYSHVYINLLFIFVQSRNVLKSIQFCFKAITRSFTYKFSSNVSSGCIYDTERFRII